MKFTSVAALSVLASVGHAAYLKEDYVSGKVHADIMSEKQVCYPHLLPDARPVKKICHRPNGVLSAIQAHSTAENGTASGASVYNVRTAWPRPSRATLSRLSSARTSTYTTSNLMPNSAGTMLRDPGPGAGRIEAGTLRPLVRAMVWRLRRFGGTSCSTLVACLNSIRRSLRSGVRSRRMGIT